MPLTQDQIRSFLDYDSETGVFTRIRAGRARHARLVGKPCGHLNAATGYVEIHVAGEKQNAHRLAWLWMHGDIPSGFAVDHINRDRSDNRAANLRLATHAQNLQNCKMRPDNTSGVKGVGFDASRGQWTAAVGKAKLGRFPTLLDAVAARRSAVARRFGEFANEHVSHAPPLALARAA